MSPAIKTAFVGRYSVNPYSSTNSPLFLITGLDMSLGLGKSEVCIPVTLWLVQRSDKKR